MLQTGKPQTKIWQSYGTAVLKVYWSVSDYILWSSGSVSAPVWGCLGGKKEARKYSFRSVFLDGLQNAKKLVSCQERNLSCLLLLQAPSLVTKSCNWTWAISSFVVSCSSTVWCWYADRAGMGKAKWQGKNIKRLRTLQLQRFSDDFHACFHVHLSGFFKDLFL